MRWSSWLRLTGRWGTEARILLIKWWGIFKGSLPSSCLTVLQTMHLLHLWVILWSCTHDHSYPVAIYLGLNESWIFDTGCWWKCTLLLGDWCWRPSRSLYWWRSREARLWKNICSVSKRYCSISVKSPPSEFGVKLEFFNNGNDEITDY